MMTRNKYFYITAIAAFILLSGMSCGDSSHEKREARLQRAIEKAEAQRRKEAARAKAERSVLRGKAQSERAKRQWADNYALIICIAFCICAINLWRIKSKRKNRRINYEE